ncbi:MAG: sortase [Anaerolineales bacterium]|nr:sortase [Anaerolineales bacterium]
MNKLLFQKLFSASLIVIIALSMMPVPRARAATLTVTTNAGGAVAVDGQCSLREAIINANNDAATIPDCIAGTGVDIIQFSAAVTTITVAGAALPAIADADGLIIDGGGDVVVDGGGAFRIFNVTGGAFTVQNITLSNGQVNGNGGAILYAGGVGLTVSSSTFNTNRNITNAANNGGGIYHTAGTFSVSNSTFNGNYTQNDGGAVYIANGTGTMTITDSVFTNQNNVAIDNGAAIHLLAGTLEINGGNFTGNSTTNGDGGAIFQDGGSLTIGNISPVTFANNSSSGNGGAISNDAGTLIVTGIFTGNSGSFGGALFYTTAAGTFTVSNSTFTNNTAVIGNAGAIRSGGNFTLTNSTFTNNSAVANGGAIWHTQNTLSISGSTFDGNYSSGLGDGGAIYLVSATGTATVDNTNFNNQNNAGIDDGAGLYIDAGIVQINGGGFAGNSATGNGGGIAVGANGTLTIGNTSGVNFANNSAGVGGGAIYFNGNSPLSVTNSIFQNNTALTNGGALVVASALASLNVSNSTFTGNTASDDGGAIVNNANPATITNSLFQNNSVTGISPNNDGGAIQNNATADGTTIRLSTFIGNTVTNTFNNNARGGAIANSGANFVLANVTFSGNSTSETGAAAGNAQGGAVWSNDNAIIHNATFSGNSVSDTGTGAADGGNVFQNGGTLTIANTILNSGTENGAAGNCGGTITDGGNNISFPAIDCGGGFTNSDPLLGGLAGTPSYFTLNISSPALNTGNNAVCATAATTNNQSQNGVTRPVGLNCEIGSYEAPTATLTLQKTVVNDNGGTALDNAWTLSANGPSAISGVEGDAAITNVTVIAGDYTLSESGGPAGYGTTGIWSCSGFVGGSQTDDDQITLASGDSVTCIITNDDIAPTLTLDKILTNDNGGATVESDWILTATGNPATIPATLSGAGAAGNTDVVSDATFDAGTYDLSETGPSGYSASAWVCAGGTQVDGDTITLALGETATCTITNDDIAPTLTLLKDITNNDGGSSVDGDWTLSTVNPSPNLISGVESDPSITNVTVNAGSYSLFETGPAGYTNTAITCIGGLDTDGSDGLDLDPGENVTCTFFNDDIGATLTLAKDVTNNNIGTAIDTDWTLSAAGPTNISGVEGDLTITGAGVSAGFFTLTESGPSGYTNTAITCIGGTDPDGSDGLALALGENVTCTFFNDDDIPVLLIPNVNSNPDTGDASVTENEVIPSSLNVTQLLVEFNWDVYDDPADLVNFADDATNPANYLLVRSATGAFNTLGCPNAVAPDVNIPNVTSVTYSNGGGSGPFIATLNLSAPLTTPGYYRLYVCGTTSIVLAADPTVALAGNGAAGTDFARNFQVVAPASGGGGGGRGGDDSRISARDLAALPATGFAPNRVTILPEQPSDVTYADLGDLWIEIPAIGVRTPIVGVPLSTEDDWDVTWLANNVGWLNGTAFPTWEGNSVVTAHVTNADGLDGPFANLKKLKYGDQIIVHLYDEKYIFEVRNSRLSRPYTTSFAFEHLEDQSYLTLITCQFYLPSSDTYFFRRIIRAVLVEVQSE